MDVPTRNRAELKSYFVKNSIPTERNFAELIDGLINQRDDGLVKLPGNPLSIEAAGDAASEKKALAIYGSFGDQNPAWTLGLNPRSNAADPATAKLGLAISDGDGRNRLFIDRNTGNLGLGTTAPVEALEVNGRVKAGALTVGTWAANGNYVFFGTNTLDQKAQGNYALLQSTETADRGRTFLNSPVDIRFRISNSDKMILANDGNVGIGTAAPRAKLDVNGPLAFTNNANIDPGRFDISPLEGMGGGILGWNRTGGEGELALIALSGGGGDGGLSFIDRPRGGPDRVIMRLKKGGNVGIGTTGPAETLDVNGRIKAGTLTIGPWPAHTGYIFFGTNSLDQKVNDNYALLQGSGVEQGRTFLNSPADIRFRIANQEKMILTNSGNVGIGTTDPASKLDVRGRIYAGESDIYFTKTDHNHSGIGNASGYAAIENAKDYDALMILGRAGTRVGRKVRLWDYLEIHGTFVNNSDQRAKQDVEDLTYGLETLKHLRPVSFNWNSIPNPHKSLGLIAQEVQPVISEVVYSGDPARDDSELSISYMGLIPILINAIKELDRELQRVKAAHTTG